ncbi:hypothetical protein E3N88_01671 [Mikania micrantha]|uniref:Uncharacterized protein n=1 Tax=Mikania micrantha TaxID=192012 RepID=A0A5N6Q1L6_9ASTR|nr:hypothetical protein E3N88_01671 [Mikania micrantha]
MEELCGGERRCGGGAVMCDREALCGREDLCCGEELCGGEVVVDERGDMMRQESYRRCFWRVMEATGRKGENRAASAVASSSSPAKEVVDWRIRVELRVLRMI